MPASPYDEIAAMYHALWVNAYWPGAQPALDVLFFSQVEARMRVLDVCCGSGHITSELTAHGYRVTGIDNSAALIKIAKTSLPQATFQVLDARHLNFRAEFDAALSTFDSLNHLLTLADLEAVFKGVHTALRKDGLFVFDMNLEEAYSLDLHQWIVSVRPQAVGLSRGVYDAITHTAQTELIWFTQTANEDCWHSRRSIVEERCYTQREILHALENSGFEKAQAHHAVDLGVNRDLGFGRYFFEARK